MRRSHLYVSVLAALVVLCVHSAERKELRIIADFEAEAEMVNFKPLEHARLELAGAEGVTRGKSGLHVVTTPGEHTAIELTGDIIKNWGSFDYFAMDIYTKHSERLRVSFELWDDKATNFPTRCTYDDLTWTHAGQNTLMYNIGRARRNEKEGRDWDELEEKDKIDLNKLKLVKIILPAGLKDGECHLWIDNLRVMQEDAAAQRARVNLPPSAKAFDFGPKGIATPGFEAVTAADTRLKGKQITDVKCTWPEALSGGGVQSVEPFTFETALPDGDYCVWLSARKVMTGPEREFRLAVGDQTLCNETLSDTDYYGEKGVFRHLRTQYSQRPNALWLDYVEPVCPEWRVKAKVTGGKLSVAITNFVLAGMLVMPAAEEPEFNRAVDALRSERMRLLDETLWIAKAPTLQKDPADKAYALWTTPTPSAVRPWSSPPSPRQPATLNATTARGGKALLALCVTAFEDLGSGDIEVSDLVAADSRIPASSIQRFHQNYTLNLNAGEAQNGPLLPWTKIRFEPGMTWAYVLWLKVPAEAKAGKYEGTVTFKPEKGGAQSVPLRVEVEPIQLIDIVPASFGLYHSGWAFPKGFDEAKLWREMLEFHRELGMTATGGSYHFNVERIEGNKAIVKFDDRYYDLVKAVGMGRSNDQRMWGDILRGGRRIAHLLNMQPGVDRDPGLELRHEKTPLYKELYKDMVRQIHEHFAVRKIPIIIQPVDEPRSMPNPWNRTVPDTIEYMKMLREVSPDIKIEVDLISDHGHNVDFTQFLDHIDVLSVHAAPYAQKLIDGALKKGKTYWIYNTARTRYSFGFYMLKSGAHGLRDEE
ncbi:MAG TPA: hypothetical protein VEJ63_06840, partial [Planctomycetota bacterium]|nr:hypothetical protein [Planctomycetota bacterium]